jgi:hypothetical protein
VHFGLASGSTPASFDNYGLIMGGSNGALASYTGFICFDVCNAQNSFYGLTTPGNSSIYADTTQIRFNILSSNKMIILANGGVGIGTASITGFLHVYGANATSITVGNSINSTSLYIGGTLVSSTAAEINYLAGLTIGTAANLSSSLSFSLSEGRFVNNLIFFAILILLRATYKCP